MNKKKIVISIDTENPQTPYFEKKFSDNRIWSRGYGIEKIVEILQSWNICATFFLNIFEYKIWGLKELRRIIHFLSKQDIQLHTHPLWIDDMRREFMFQYSLEEQKRIIKFGKDLIEELSGNRISVHRAGGYGIDQNTLIACAENGIIIESSNYYSHPNCKYIVTKNDPVQVEGLIEYPVSVFNNGNGYVKLDIDCLEYREMINLLNSFLGGNSEYLHIMFHSYSLTTTKDGFRTYIPNELKINYLDQLCKYISALPLEIVPFRNLLSAEKEVKEKSKYRGVRKRKILHIGGSHTTHLRDLMSELNREGYEQAIISPTDKSNSYLNETYPIYTLNYTLNDTNKDTILYKTHYDTLRNDIKNILRAEKPNIIHAHSLSSILAVKIVKQLSDIPVFVTPWNMLRHYKQSGIVYDLEKEILPIADKFIVPLREAFLKYQQIYPGLKEKNWIKSGYIINIDKKFRRDLKDLKPKILSARQIDEQYNQHMLIEAIAILKNINPEVELTIMRGPNPEQGQEYYNYCMYLMHKYKLINNCRIIPNNVSYFDFYNAIKTHNIVFSLYEYDLGYSVTNILGITSGAAVIMNDSPINNLSILLNRKNIFKVSSNSESVQSELRWIIENVPEALQNVENFKHEFFQFDKDELLKPLVEAYSQT